MLEQNTKTKVRLSWWPSPQDYNESVQNPQSHLKDDEMQAGLIYTDQHGIPRPVSGAFATVYRLKCRQRDIALRCFLRNITDNDQEQRYDQISAYLKRSNLPYIVTFQFLQEGVQVLGRWFPSLKMEWVEGESLDQYILRNLTNSEKLERLANSFLQMMLSLKAAGIAHGDLQHGNIVVLSNDELRLVDYDGMYVPTMETTKSLELGHRNFQHPKRSDSDFGSAMDNFSAWTIYASILGLQVDPHLWFRLGAGDDCLLFRQSDYLDP